MGILLAAAIVVATALVVAFKVVVRKSFQKQREALDLSTIRASVTEPISPEIFNAVWLKVGEAFSLDPRLIRPDDPLKKLSEIDSWDLGKGDDILSVWLNQKQLGALPPLNTVLDIAKWLQAHEDKDTY